MSDLFEPSEDPDGLDAELGPFAKPDGSKILKWYLYKNPRAYMPFLVEVVENEDGTLRYFLCNKHDAERAHSTAIKVDITDGTRIYQDIPSTAQLADPDDPEKRYGFLFLSSAYIQELGDMPGIGPTVIELTQGIGKWPKGASMLVDAVHELIDRTQRGSTLVSAVRKLAARSDLQDVLTPEELAAVDGLLADRA